MTHTVFDRNHHCPALAIQANRQAVSTELSHIRHRTLTAAQRVKWGFIAN
jgi:hypothetical protein